MKIAEILIEEQKLKELEQELDYIKNKVKKQRKKVVLMKLLKRLQTEEINDLSL